MKILKTYIDSLIGKVYMNIEKTSVLMFFSMSLKSLQSAPKTRVQTNKFNVPTSSRQNPERIDHERSGIENFFPNLVPI